MTEINDRQAIVREICRAEGHNTVEITTQGDGDLLHYVCKRGCGAHIRELRSGAQVDVDWVIGRLTDPVDKVTVTRLEFILEPEDEE